MNEHREFGPYPKHLESLPREAEGKGAGWKILLDNGRANAQSAGMAFAELNIAPRTKGRGAKQVDILPAGELTAADLALLASERGVQAPAIKEIRERHHALARCLADGMKDAEASAITGYSPSRISILKSDPSFQALMQDYRTMNSAVTADFVQRTQVLSLTVVNRLQEAVEDEETPLSASTLLEIGKFAADRTGNAPVQKNVNLNVNADLGNKLDAARRRLAAAQVVSIEVRDPVENQSRDPVGSQSTSSSDAPLSYPGPSDE